MNVLDYVKIEHLKGEQRELAELIGIEAYRKIVANYGGERVFISRIDSVIFSNKDELIRAALKREKESEICSAFHVTRRELERIKCGCK